MPEDILLETGKLIRNIINEILNNKIEISDESEKILEFNHDMPDDNYLILRTQELSKKFKLKKIKFFHAFFI